VPEFSTWHKARVNPAQTVGTAPLESQPFGPTHRSIGVWYRFRETAGLFALISISGWTNLLIQAVYPLLALANVRRPCALDERQHGPNIGIAEDVPEAGMSVS
jgi:hypothetical protein